MPEWQYHSDTRVTGARTSGIAAMLGAITQRGSDTAVAAESGSTTQSGSTTRSRRVPPARGDQLKNWRATDPKTSGHQPKNWSGRLYFFTLSVGGSRARDIFLH